MLVTDNTTEIQAVVAAAATTVAVLDAIDATTRVYFEKRGQMAMTTNASTPSMCPDITRNEPQTYLGLNEFKTSLLPRAWRSPPFHMCI